MTTGAPVVAGKLRRERVSKGVSVAGRSLGQAAEAPDGTSNVGRSPTSTGARSDGMQRRTNDLLWAGDRLVRAYANRGLRPVEVDILIRYRMDLCGRVLELGCGAGRLTGYLAEIATAVRGIDISASMIDYSRRRYPAVSFEQGDLRDPAVYVSAPWDAIVAPYNIVDVLDDADRQLLLGHVHEALAPNGIFVMSSHNRAVESHLADQARLIGLSLVDIVSSLGRLPRWWRNRRRLLAFEQHEPSYAILNDPGHDYSVLHYYITRDAQEQQLADHGFEMLECLDLDGARGARRRRGPSSELHYVARRHG